MKKILLSITLLLLLCLLLSPVCSAAEAEEGVTLSQANTVMGEWDAYVLGDADMDGKITNADVTRMNAANLGKITIDAFNMILNDVNGDGKFTNADVTRMNAANLGKISLGWN